MRSPVGAGLARPWFDPVALWLLGRWYFPLSRLWAAARAANGSLLKFYEEVPMDPIPGIGARLRKTLDRFETAREAVNATEARWRQVFFGEAGTELYRLVAIEAARRDRRNAYNATRRHFSYLRRRRPILPVRWDVPGVDEVEADYGAWLANPAAAFAPIPPFPEVFESQRVPGPVGEEYWLRFRSPSPVMDDDVFARVYEPVGVADPPTLVFGHGICVEFDHWHGLVDEVFLMCQMGIRVVRPEAPWHGRRVPDGRYGGEMFIARAPRGALDTFSAQLLEWPVLIDWSRRTSRGPVAVGGSSLGALLSQLLAVRASAWPAGVRPDALFLVTHCGHHEDAALRGSMARLWGVADAIAARGWTRDEAVRWLPLLDPQGGPPAMDPENIVTVLGSRDTVTPFATGKALIDDWRVPAENRFIWRRGHFSVPLQMMRDRTPLDRLKQLLERLGTSG
ncbi:MAG: hypothetical protein OXI22_20290 [Defluviicoccus sp.]|nr:hypothetical protein [Defluviicoccus sp.]MDE0386231.1 hypothetical protein [Defluviicoccus sp.]